MYEDYNSLREALEDLVDGNITKEEAMEVLSNTDDSIHTKEDFYLNAYLENEPDSVKLAVIQSLLGTCPGTATDVDRAENILKQINDLKWQL